MLRNELGIEQAELKELETALAAEEKTFNAGILAEIELLTEGFKESLGANRAKWDEVFGPPPRILVESVLGYSQDEDFTR